LGLIRLLPQTQCHERTDSHHSRKDRQARLAFFLAPEVGTVFWLAMSVWRGVVDEKGGLL